METTRMLESLKKMREHVPPATSDMEIIRIALDRATGKIGQSEMPVILTEPQRAYFIQEIDKLSGFLESEDGTDAVELLFNTFKAYVAKYDPQPEEDDEKIVVAPELHAEPAAAPSAVY